MLLANPGSHRERIANFFAERGVASGRIAFTALCPHEELMRCYQRADIALDPFPYNGMTTTCEALHMGVPVITLIGNRPTARASWSLLSNIGLPQWAARTEEEYVHKAVAIATDLSQLIQIRATLREKMEGSPLMDTPRFVRNLEAAYLAIWQHWCETAPQPE